MVMLESVAAHRSARAAAATSDKTDTTAPAGSWRRPQPPLLAEKCVIEPVMVGVWQSCFGVRPRQWQTLGIGMTQNESVGLQTVFPEEYRDR